MSNEVPAHPAVELKNRASGESDGEVRPLISQRSRAELKYVLSQLTDGAVVGDSELLFSDEAGTNVTREELGNLIVWIHENVNAESDD